MDVARPSLIYLHGFCSSPAGWKSLYLQQTLNKMGLADRFDCPALDPVPANAIAQVEALIQSHLDRGFVPVLIGSSLGGFYAQALAERHGLKAVLINPVVWSGIDPAHFLGEHRNYHTGESFTFTTAHITQLAALDGPITNPARYLLLVETGDEVLDAQHALTRYAACPQVVVEGGEHGFKSFREHLPRILTFAGW